MLPELLLSFFKHGASLKVPQEGQANLALICYAQPSYSYLLLLILLLVVAAVLPLTWKLILAVYIILLNIRNSMDNIDRI